MTDPLSSSKSWLVFRQLFFIASENADGAVSIACTHLLETSPVAQGNAAPL